MKGTMAITGDPASDELLNTEPLAVLLGMLLDQQVPMEWAFKGPATLKERLGGTLDATAIAAMPTDDFVAICAQKPAIHRFPGSMGKRAWELCRVLVDEYGGDAAAVWTDVGTGQELYDRLRALPGYGDEKTKIFMAILAKRFGTAPVGWEAVAAPFSDDQHRSVADIDSPETLAEVRAWKQLMKAQKKSKQDQPT